MEFVLTKTTTEKLQDIFFTKCSSFYDSHKRRGVGWQAWSDYLNDLDGVEYIHQFSNFASSVDYLLESINESTKRRIVIKDTGSAEYFSNKDNFILLEPELAMKILTLGVLP